MFTRMKKSSLKNKNFKKVNPYGLLPWIHINKLSWLFLSSNPSAIHILEQNIDDIDWRELSSNAAAIHLLEQYPDNIDWSNLSDNPSAIHLLEKNMDKIDWSNLSSNHNAFHLLEKNMDFNRFVTGMLEMEIYISISSEVI